MKLVIEIKDQKIEVTESEAQKLFLELKGIFGGAQTMTFPYPVMVPSEPRPIEWTCTEGTGDKIPVPFTVYS